MAGLIDFDYEPQKKAKPGLYDPHNVDPNDIHYIGENGTEYQLWQEGGKKQAVKDGLLIVEPDDKTLQLDFDTPEQWDKFLSHRLSWFLKFFPVVRVWWTASKSGNKHVYITLLEPQPLERRVALQAVLGSDPTREFLNLMRVFNGMTETGNLPVVLFETPEAVEIVIYATDGYQPALTAGTPQELLTAGD
jgi:hypothetical protein